MQDSPRIFITIFVWIFFPNRFSLIIIDLDQWILRNGFFFNAHKNTRFSQFFLGNIRNEFMELVVPNPCKHEIRGDPILIHTWLSKAKPTIRELAMPHSLKPKNREKDLNKDFYLKK